MNINALLKKGKKPKRQGTLCFEQGPHSSVDTSPLPLMSLPWGNYTLAGADKQGNALNRNKTQEWPKTSWQLYQPWGKKGLCSPSQVWVFLMTANLRNKLWPDLHMTFSHLPSSCLNFWMPGEAGACLQDSIHTAIISCGCQPCCSESCGNERLSPQWASWAWSKPPQRREQRGLQEQQLLSCSRSSSFLSTPWAFLYNITFTFENRQHCTVLQ